MTPYIPDLRVCVRNDRFKKIQGRYRNKHKQGKPNNNYKRWTHIALKKVRNALKSLLFGKKDSKRLPGYIKIYRQQPDEEELDRR